MGKFKVGDVVKFKDSIKIGNSYNSVMLNTDIYDIHKKESFKVKKVDSDNTILSEMGVWIGFDAIELISSTKSLTITTSDTITTITDGTHTTSINRYYTDKHNERNAVSIVIDKYYDELVEFERVSKLPKVGDKVKVVDKELTYDTYKQWLVKNNISIESALKWSNGELPKNGMIFEIIMIVENHVLIENDRECFLVDIKGLEVVK